MGKYTLIPEHGYCKEGDTIHYVELNTPQGILYVLTKEYPNYVSITIPDADIWRSQLLQLKNYGVYTVQNVVAHRYNFSDRLIIIPLSIIHSALSNPESLKDYVIQHYQNINKSIADKMERAPSYIYVDGLNDYEEYKKLRTWLKEESGEFFQNSIIYFADYAQYKKFAEAEELSNVLSLVADFIESIPKDQKYEIRSDNEWIQDWVITKDLYSTQFMLLRKLYQHIISIKEPYIVYYSRQSLHPQALAAFALAFITHGKKLIIADAGMLSAYENFIMKFCGFQFGTIEDRIDRFHELAVINSIRVFISHDGGHNLCVVRDADFSLKYQVVRLDKLLNLIREKDGKVIYKVDADEFDSCGEIYDTCFDFSLEDEDGEALYSIVDPITVLGLENCMDEGVPDSSLKTEGTQEGRIGVNTLYKVFRLIDQYIYGYTKFTTLRDCITIQGPENELYIGRAELSYQLYGDIISVGEKDGHIVPGAKLPNDMCDHSIIYDFDAEKVNMITTAYATKYFEPLPEDFEIYLAPIEVLTERQQMMALYWACKDVTQKVYMNCEEVGLNVFDRGMANSTNYQMYQHMYPFLWRNLRPYGFRDFTYNESPLNIYGGFRYSKSDNRSDMETVKLYLEAFKQFPGKFQRVGG